MSGARRLVSTRRRVGAAQRDGYHTLWGELHGRATALGAHAWRFAAAAEPELFLEFLEFRAGSDPRADAAVDALLRRMDAEAGTSQAEEWDEVRAP